MVPSCSNLCLNRGTASLSQDFAGHEAGVTEVMERHRAASGSNSSKNLKDTHYYLLIQLLEYSITREVSKTISKQMQRIKNLQDHSWNPHMFLIVS